MRMLPMVIVVMGLVGCMFLLAGLIQYEKEQELLGAEGPYRKAQVGRCVCK